MLKKWLITISCVLSMVPTFVAANAYCSLRDPVSAIQYLYPAATNHQSIVKVVGKEARASLSDVLPFTLHFNELGKHTLYVALNDRKPSGLIHARTELTDRGLIEIAWALDLDLSIKNFYIQRCRLAECKDEKIEFLRNFVKGKTFEEVLSLYNSADKELYEELFYQTEEMRSLISSIIQSALKTMVITDLVWKKDIEKLSSIALAKQYYPEAAVAEKIEYELSNKELMDLKSKFGNDVTYINHDSISSLKISDASGKNIAYFVNAEWSVENNTGEFSWLISPQGEIVAVQPKSSWPSLEIEDSFNTVVGKNVKSPAECGTFAEVTASELFYVSGIHKQRFIK